MTKGELLDYLAQVATADAKDVADVFEIQYAAAAMALLRLTRQGLVRRYADEGHALYFYELTDRGHDRLEFFRQRDWHKEEATDARNPRHHRRAAGRSAAHHRFGRVEHHEVEAMKRRKMHTGTLHCPQCFIEFELFAEQSLACDQCQGPLAAGTLDQVWSDNDE
jgi:DNA-binding MarR family transcriptional regulator